MEFVAELPLVKILQYSASDSLKELIKLGQVCHRWRYCAVEFLWPQVRRLDIYVRSVVHPIYALFAEVRVNGEQFPGFGSPFPDEFALKPWRTFLTFFLRNAKGLTRIRLHQYVNPKIRSGGVHHLCPLLATLIVENDLAVEEIDYRIVPSFQDFRVNVAAFARRFSNFVRSTSAENLTLKIDNFLLLQHLLAQDNVLETVTQLDVTRFIFNNDLTPRNASYIFDRLPNLKLVRTAFSWPYLGTIKLLYCPVSGANLNPIRYFLSRFLLSYRGKSVEMRVYYENWRDNEHNLDNVRIFYSVWHDIGKVLCDQQVDSYQAERADDGQGYIAIKNGENVIKVFCVKENVIMFDKGQSFLKL